MNKSNNITFISFPCSNPSSKYEDKNTFDVDRLIRKIWEDESMSVEYLDFIVFAMKDFLIDEIVRIRRFIFEFFNKETDKWGNEPITTADCIDVILFLCSLNIFKREFVMTNSLSEIKKIQQLREKDACLYEWSVRYDLYDEEESERDTVNQDEYSQYFSKVL